MTVLVPCEWFVDYLVHKTLFVHIFVNFSVTNRRFCFDCTYSNNLTEYYQIYDCSL